MSGQANIRDIQVLSDLKNAFGRFGEEVRHVLPALQKQFEEIEIEFDERQRHWERQVAEAGTAVNVARGELSDCQEQNLSDDEDDGEVFDCSYAEESVIEAERQLAVCEENLETVKQWRHRLEGLIVDFQNDIHRLSDLASVRTGSAQAFLANKMEILNNYIVGVSSAFALVGLHNQNQNDIITLDVGVGSSTIRMRERIRNAKYASSELLRGGINTSVILKNGVKVLFKPVEGEDPRVKPRGIQARREKAVSKLDELLGLGLVPPTEIIKYEGLTGSAQLFKDGFATAWHLHRSGVIKLPNLEMLTHRQRQNWQLIDELTGNRDRHDGNWMLRRCADASFELALIDNGLCFMNVGQTVLRIHPVSQQRLDSVNRSRLEQLLATEKEWRLEFEELIGIDAVEYMTDRARNLLIRDYYE